MLKSLKMLTTKFKNREFREAFVQQNVFSSIAHQIQINRLERNWSQKDLAERLGTSQSAISRYEDSSYGKYSLDTLFRIASAFDIGIQIRFVSWTKVVGDAEAWDPSEDYIQPFDMEVEVGDEAVVIVER